MAGRGQLAVRRPRNPGCSGPPALMPLALLAAPRGVPECRPHRGRSVPRAWCQTRHQLREEPLCLIGLVLRLHVRHCLHRESPGVRDGLPAPPRSASAVSQLSPGTHCPLAALAVQWGLCCYPALGCLEGVAGEGEPQTTPRGSASGTGLCPHLRLLSWASRGEAGEEACLPRGDRAPSHWAPGAGGGSRPGGPAGPLRAQSWGRGGRAAGRHRGLLWQRGLGPPAQIVLP